MINDDWPSDAITSFGRFKGLSGNGGNGHDTSAKKSKSEYALRGANAIDYAGKPFEPNSCVLGDRYLTRRSGMFFVAPSGQGKSTAVMQALVCWCCGKECFDIEPPRPQRVTLIQAEDDDADLADMAKVVNHLDLTNPEKALVAKNSWIETLNDKVGIEAIGAIDSILSARPCDLIILNPYLAYLGADSKDEEANSLFLRAHFQGLLNRHNCAALIVHHTPKTNFRQKTERWSTMDWMYSGAGAAVLTNWARAILAMDPMGESHVFKFIAAKRGQRIGWDQSINYFRHDERPGVLLWTKASALEIAAATSAGKKGSLSRETLIELVPVCDGISVERLHDELKKKGVSLETRKTEIALAVEDGDLHFGWLWLGGRGQKRKMIYRGADDLFPNAED